MKGTVKTNKSLKSNVLCVVCKSPIHEGAKVCIQCKSTQDWTRYVFQWKEFIAVLVAVIPLFAGAYSLYQIATKVEKPKVKFFAVECNRNEVTLALANDGNAMALLSRPELFLRRNSGPSEATSITLTFKKVEDYPVVFGAKQTASVVAFPSVGTLGGEYPSASRTGELCELEFRIKSQDSDGKIMPISTRCPCPPRS